MDVPTFWRAASIQLLAVLLLAGALGAVLAGLPSLLAVLIGLHWVGVLLAIVLFGDWCTWLRAQLLREY